MTLQLLILDNCSCYCTVSSVCFPKISWGKKYEKYESMKSHTFSLEIFSKGKFFIYFYLFLELNQSMI